MDLDIIQSTKEGEITQFLCDVRDYFKASLATSEYENTSNVFYLTAADTTEQLLKRCECLLRRLKNKNPNPLQAIQIKNYQWQRIHEKSCNDVNSQRSIDVKLNEKEIDGEDVSYLDMSASQSDSGKKQISVGLTVDLNSSAESDKSFRCSTFLVRQNKSFLHRLHDTVANAAKDKTYAEEERELSEDKTNNFEDDTQIYDICQVTTQGSDGEEDGMGLEETQKPITQNSHFSLPNVNCPYLDLPAGHLSIKKSIKYGQLLKIEKRLFFDQSKKCYCGILNDWLLCYADGPTSSKPTVSLYLKIPGIEIEHFGEGKRREVCFQITTGDADKKFVFQAVNEIDAKEWIHAIEASIRSDLTGTEFRNSSTRKLPTPPVIKKITFLNSFKDRAELLSDTTSTDCIYEEPSPIDQIVTQCNTDKPPELPRKQNNHLELAHKFDYDVPKCPPQPFDDNPANDILLINPYEQNETNTPEKTQSITSSDSLNISSSPTSAQKMNLKIEENLDFQAKVKDVHSKLTSHLSNGPNIKKPLKKPLPSTSKNDSESLPFPAATLTLPETLDLKKQKKISTPSVSPQKNCNEKSSFAKSWFLNRLNKTTSSTRSNSSSPSSSPSKCKQGEKENLLSSASEACDAYDNHLTNETSKSVSSIAKSSSPSSKVNMIINQLEASGHLASIFNTDAVATFSPFSNNEFSNYEPVMTVSSTPANLMKKI